MTRYARLATLPAAALLLAACSSGSSGPTATDFHPGACRSAAGPVLAVGKEVGKLGKGSVPQDVTDKLTTAQNALAPLLPNTAPTQAPLVQLVRLQTSVGLLRLRSVAGTDDATLRGDVKQAYQDVLAACTGASPTPS